jgi:AcrR family transcriptional regulator
MADSASTAEEPIGRRNRAAPKRTSPLREAQKGLTRDLLTSAAQTAFEQRGYVEVTVDDIVRDSGASRATFYLYFESKAAVLEAVMNRIRLREDYQQLLQHFTTISDPTVDSIEVWLDEYVDFYLKHRGLHRAIHQAQAIEPEFAKARLADLRRYIELWRSLGFVENTDSEDLRLAAMMTFALADETLYLWLVDGFEVDRGKVTRALAESFHATFQRG